MQSETESQNKNLPAETISHTEGPVAQTSQHQQQVASTSPSSHVDKYRAVLDQVISYLERLGVCIASLVGSAAIIYFRSEIFAAMPIVPAIVGGLAFFGSLFLTVWVAADQFVRLPSLKSKFWSCVAAAAVLIPSTCLVLAGLFGALNGFAP